MPWYKLKWRVPSKEAQNIWYAVKFLRDQIKKGIGLFDKNGNEFSFCILDLLEPKLHKIVQFGTSKMTAIADPEASINIQENYLVSSLLMEEAITSAQLEGAATTRADAKKNARGRINP